METSDSPSAANALRAASEKPCDYTVFGTESLPP